MADAPATVEEQSTSLTSNAARQAQAALEKALSVTVDTPENAEGMTRLIEFCDAQVAKLESARKSLTGPLNQQIRFINSQFKEARTTFESASYEGRQRLAPYLKKLREEEERAEREAQEAAQRAADEAMRQQRESESAMQKQADAAKEARVSGGEPPTPPPPPEPPPPPPPVAPPKARPKGDKKTASTQKVRKWKLKDITKVPIEYLTTRDGEITKAVKGGAEEIPGIEIYIEETVVMK